MMKVKLQRVSVRTNRSTIVDKEIAPWELPILKQIHGEESVLEPIQTNRVFDVESINEEQRRLIGLYGKGVLISLYGQMMTGLSRDIEDNCAAKTKKNVQSERTAVEEFVPDIDEEFPEEVIENKAKTTAREKKAPLP